MTTTVNSGVGIVQNILIIVLQDSIEKDIDACANFSLLVCLPEWLKWKRDSRSGMLAYSHFRSMTSY